MERLTCESSLSLLPSLTSMTAFNKQPPPDREILLPCPNLLKYFELPVIRLAQDFGKMQERRILWTRGRLKNGPLIINDVFIHWTRTGFCKALHPQSLDLLPTCQPAPANQVIWRVPTPVFLQLHKMHFEQQIQSHQWPQISGAIFPLEIFEPALPSLITEAIGSALLCTPWARGLCINPARALGALPRSRSWAGRDAHSQRLSGKPSPAAEPDFPRPGLAARAGWAQPRAGGLCSLWLLLSAQVLTGN